MIISQNKKSVINFLFLFIIFSTAKRSQTNYIHLIYLPITQIGKKISVKKLKLIIVLQPPMHKYI